MRTVILAILLLPASLWGQGVVFNEIDANPLGGSSHEFVELHNAASVPVDVSGWKVESGIEYVFGEGTVIPAGGYLVLAKDPLVFATRFTVPANVLVGGYRFTLDNSGETIRLLDADGVTRDQVRYGRRFPWPDTTPPMAGASGTSLERLCARAGGNASSNWRASVLRGPTPGARNNSVQCPPPVYVPPPVVINEIFYDSLERPDSETEFIELQNTTNQSVDISDWQFTDGIVFTFPSNTFLPPSGLLVVARNADAIKARHGITNVVGDYTNRLADTGEWIELSNKDLVPVEAVRYSDGSSWPPAAAGFEFSLEKLNPRADPTDPASWRSAIGGTSGAGFQDVVFTGTATSSELQIYLEGGGEALIDDVGLILAVGPSPEYFPGGNFESGAGDWNVSGNHGNSRWQSNGGFGDSACLRVISTGSGGSLDSIRRIIVPDLVNGVSYRVRLKVKILSGDSPLVCRLEGSTDSTGIFRRTDLSGSLSSPGKRNTVYTTSLPPFVIRNTNSPSQPLSTQRVAVTCLVTSASSITSVELSYRAGPDSGDVRLFDDGSHSDGLAGDGVFGNRLRLFPHSTLVDYTITATNSAGRSWTFPQGNIPNGRSTFYVHDDQPLSTLTIYHLLGVDLGGLDCSDYSSGDLVRNGIVYRNVGVRNSGDCTRTKRNLRLRFNRGRIFRGRRKILLGSLWSDKSLIRERLAWNVFRDHAQADARAFHVRIHNDGDYYGLYLQLDDPGGNYLEKNGLVRNGNLYKSKNSAEQKQASLAAYEAAYSKENNRSGSYLDLAQFLDGLNTVTDAQLVEWLHANVDFESELDYQTCVVAVSSSDHNAKNHFLYHDPLTLRWKRLIWDLDLSYGRYFDPLNGGALNDAIAPTLVDPLFGMGTNVMTTKIFDAQSGGSAKKYFRRALYGRLWAHLREKSNESLTTKKVESLRRRLADEHEDDFLSWGRFPARPDPNHPADFDPNVDELLDIGAVPESGFLLRRMDYLRGELSKVGFSGFPWVRITEIMYHPPLMDTLEFVEIHNTESTPVNISGWYVEPANYEFPAGTTLLAGKIAIVCRDPVAFRVAYPGVSPLFGPYPGKLRNSGGVVRLLEGRPGQAPNFPKEHPLTIDSVAYRDGSGWPAAADGFGDSLELRHLSFDNDLPGSWRASTDPGGSPGVLNTINLKPVIELSLAPRAGDAPLNVHFDASKSSDIDGDTLVFSWIFGDGTVASGSVVNHTYATPGTYAGSVTVGDGVRTPVVETFQIGVTQPNRPPLVQLVVTPLQGKAPLEVSFDASGSSDADGDAFTVAWNFGDGTTAAGSLARTHTYASAGVYEGTLTLDDGSAPPVVDSFQINVTTLPPPNLPPVIELVVMPVQGKAPLTVSFDARGSSDPDGDAFTVAWAFGDGGTATGLFDPMHMYAAVGVYQGTLTLDDGKNPPVTESFQIKVTSTPPPNRPPVTELVVTPVQGAAALTVSFDARGSSDPDGDAFTVAWDFGDGATATGSLVQTHIYAAAGVYQGTLTLDDGKNPPVTGSFQIDVTVVPPPNLPPVIDLVVTPVRGVFPLTVSFDAKGSSDPDSDVFTISWDFGDGAAVTGSLVRTHTYTVAGVYQGTLTLDDDKNPPAVESFEIEVTEVQPETDFIRGDVNVDGRHDISDPISILGHIFLGNPGILSCKNTADVDDNGRLEITDPIVLIGYLFLGTRPPSPPFGDCGRDLNDDPFGCVAYPPCEIP